MSEVDYSAVLADLHRRRDEMDTAIRAIEQIAGQATVGGTGGAEGAEIRSDTFFGMSILDGAKKYLRMTKKPQKQVAIARALKRGGLINQSPNFESTVGTTLRRAQERDGGVVQTKDKSWGLAEWYPKGAKLPKAQREDMTDDETDEQVDASQTPIEFPAAASGNGQPS